MTRRGATARGSAGGVETAAETAAVAGWLARQNLRAAAVDRLAGDVSTRSYYRVALAGETTSWIVARYPADLADAQRRFVAAAALLAGAGVRVPAIRLDDPAAGFALIEDLGPRTLYDAFANWRGAAAELASALAAATAIARLDRDTVAELGSPALDASLLRRELRQTRELLLAPRGLDGAELASALDAVCDRLASGDLVACHRDFMARNLVPLGDRGEVAVLDFQDLRLGPPAYDLASLLNDSLFADDELEAATVADAGFSGDAGPYQAAVVQRSLKAVGTYLAFARRGLRRHLPLVEPTLERALRHFGAVPETAALGAGIVEELRAAGRDAALC